MNQKNDGGPAFPEVRKTRQEPGQKARVQRVRGMSLRDYFAGQALAGMLADLPKTMYGLDWEANAAQGAYKLADAMLAARGAP